MEKVKQGVIVVLFFCALMLLAYYGRECQRGFDYDEVRVIKTINKQIKKECLN